MLVPWRRAPRSTGFVVVRRTTRVDPFPFAREPLVVASRARSVADAARDAATVAEARAVVVEAVQRGLVRVGDLRHELEAGPRRESLLLRRAVQDAEAGSWSRPEADLARLCRRSPLLPEPWLNPDLTAPDGTALPRPDGWFDDAALAVQVHSREHHDGPEAWDATVMSDGVYAEYGIAVVGVTPRSVERRPDVVLRRLENAYSAALRRPRPDVLAAATAHGLVSS